MIRLPGNITDPVFDAQYKRGAVIRTKIRFESGKATPIPKFLIIVNHNLAGDSAIFFVTTSQLEFYNKHPQYNKDVIRILSGQLKFFSRETIINCREVHQLPVESLRTQFNAGVLDIVGELPAQMLTDIDNIVMQSFFLSKDEKTMILGE